MKKLFLLLFIFSFTLSFVSYGQEDGKELSRKEKRALEKQKRAQLDSIYAIEIKKALDDRQWVLEADRLSNKMGQTVNVNSNLNFVAIHGKQVYVQLGRNSGMGPNGVGGVTVDADITKYEVKPGKKGTYFIHVFASSPIGSFDIRIDMNSTGQMASATIQGNSSRRVTYSGQVVPASKSTVYKGTPLF